MYIEKASVAGGGGKLGGQMKLMGRTTGDAFALLSFDLLLCTPGSLQPNRRNRWEARNVRNAEMNKKGKADGRQEEGGGVHVFQRLAGLTGYRSRTTKRERTHQAGMTLSRRLWSSQHHNKAEMKMAPLLFSLAGFLGGQHLEREFRGNTWLNGLSEY